MKNTKAVILKTSLELFNTAGLSQVTLRTIANKMEISQGNLCYHFKKREYIIESLYFQLVQNIDESMQRIEQNPNLLSYMFSVSNDIMLNFYDYRFFFIDMVQILRENEKINTHYIALTHQREEQFSALFNLLKENDYLRPERLKNEYKNLYKRIQILGDFWISSAETTEKGLSQQSINEYSEILNQQIYPYLTEKGRTEYDLIQLT